LRKIGRDSYELIRGQNPLDGFLKFWQGFWPGVEGDDSARGSRGYVLFMLGDTGFDFERLFSFCYDPGVMAPSSLRSSLGRGLYKKIIAAVAENPNCTAIVLGDKGSLTNMTVFPSAAVFERRLEQAIALTRKYDLKRVYGDAVRAD
jgi:hypothetical protein